MCGRTRSTTTHTAGWKGRGGDVERGKEEVYIGEERRCEEGKRGRMDRGGEEVWSGREERSETEQHSKVTLKRLQ